MKKFTIILFLIALFYNIPSFGQTVTTSITLVNNANTNSTGPINLGTNATSNISLSTNVSLPSAQNDSYPGTITVYYQKNTSSPALIPVGGNGSNLLFLGGTSASRSFVITLDATQFDLTGGILYVEFKSYYGSKYKSSNISIIKTNTTTPPAPIQQPDPNYASQIVPYGGIPLMPFFAFQYNISSQNWVNTVNNSPALNQGYGDNWILFKSVIVRQQTILTNGNIIYEPKQMDIRVSNFLPNVTHLSVNNEIKNNMYITQGQIPNEIIGNQASESHSISVPGIRRSITTNLLNNYQWQSRIIYPFLWEIFDYGMALYGWKDIPNANQANYSPPTPTCGMEYRRLVLENPLDQSINYRNCATSNVITVYPIDNTDIGNIICCDQTVYSNRNPSPITGSISRTGANYIWESSLDGINWVSCNSTVRDFTPVRPIVREGGRNGFVGPIKYRRIAFFHGATSIPLYYISNVSTIVYSNLTAKIKKTEKEDDNLDNLIKLFPNPTSSIINVTGINNLSPTKINIINMEGKVIISRLFNTSINGSIEIDISSFTAGIYEVELENEDVKTTKKLIKN